jgi:hypothetical protein
VRLILFLTLATAAPPAIADDPPDKGYARVEVRGKLEPWTLDMLDRDRYVVSFKDREKDQWRQFLLDLSDEATKKAAKELINQEVVVTGDLSMRQVGDGGRSGKLIMTVMWVSVKGLKKAEPPPKK